jgi:hypothetical protein
MSASSTTAPAPSPVGSALLGGVVLFAAAVALLGAVLAIGLMRPDPQGVVQIKSGPFAVAQDVPISFGVVAVEHATKIPGLSKRSVASSDHGIPGFVPQDRAQLELAVTLRNTTLEPVAYDPRQFAVRVAGQKQPVRLQAASVKAGRLQPHASVDATLRFNVPAKRRGMTVTFADPQRVPPARIELGRLKMGRSIAPSQPIAVDPPSDISHQHGK